MREPLTRDIIVNATRQILATEGLNAVTLRRVARTLNVTAPALYAHVQDKQDLLRAVAEGEFAQLIDRFENVTTADPIERIRELSRAYIAHARQNPELFKVMFLFPPDLSAVPGTGREIPAATKAFTSSAAATDHAIAVGAFAPVDPLLAALTTWACVHGVATILQLGFNFDADTEERIVTAVVETMISGLHHGPI